MDTEICTLHVRVLTVLTKTKKNFKKKNPPVSTLFGGHGYLHVRVLTVLTNTCPARERSCVALSQYLYVCTSKASKLRGLTVLTNTCPARERSYVALSQYLYVCTSEASKLLALLGAAGAPVKQVHAGAAGASKARKMSTCWARSAMCRADTCSQCSSPTVKQVN